ncbi:ParA family protein [Candidatus Poribacteria bacterium]|nr:ParA family protein [Candidatus Poribacteria bacterium]
MTTTIPQPERKPIFVTFYSFKGGVGRTMALVNAACILAGRGRRVLMIDFDLEAPGLTTLALKQLGVEGEDCPAGLVDLIHDVLTDPANSALADKENPTRYAQKYVCSLKIPENLIRRDGGKLDLMPCGRLDATYEERLYAINFAELYAEGIGQPLFKHLKNLIRDSGLYDYILIDSRTGFSDEGGISTRDLADHIALLMGLNRQNIDGTVRFLTRLKASGWEEGEIVFILSPIPIGYEELRAERTAYAKKEIEEKTGFKAEFNLRIPYHPRLALDEEPFVYNWKETDLFSAYESVCEKLQELAEDTSWGWFQRSIEALQNAQWDEAELYWDHAQLMVASRIQRQSISFSKEHFLDLAKIQLKRVPIKTQVLLGSDEPHAALKYLNDNWEGIQRYADADDRAKAHLLREQIRLKLNDAAGAVEDAEAALKFYRDQNVHTQAAKDAEELLQKAKEGLK